MSCPFCNFSSDLLKLKIHEFKHSYWLVGEHQFIPNYTFLIFKNHIREMTELNLKIQQEFFSEIMQASSIIQKVFKPIKMNYASLGNQVEHLHWHLFPRMNTERDFKMHPWFNQNHFSEHKTTIDQSQNIIKLIKPHL
ncbi:MAG: HIT family protein [Bacteriovoracaceae bacterium]